MGALARVVEDGEEGEAAHAEGGGEAEMVAVSMSAAMYPSPCHCSISASPSARSAGVIQTGSACRATATVGSAITSATSSGVASTVRTPGR